MYFTGFILNLIGVAIIILAKDAGTVILGFGLTLSGIIAQLVAWNKVGNAGIILDYQLNEIKKQLPKN